MVIRWVSNFRAFGLVLPLQFFRLLVFSHKMIKVRVFEIQLESQFLICCNVETRLWKSSKVLSMLYTGIRSSCTLKNKVQQFFKVRWLFFSFRSDAWESIIWLIEKSNSSSSKWCLLKACDWLRLQALSSQWWWLM